MAIIAYAENEINILLSITPTLKGSRLAKGLCHLGERGSQITHLVLTSFPRESSQTVFSPTSSGTGDCVRIRVIDNTRWLLGYARQR